MVNIVLFTAFCRFWIIQKILTGSLELRLIIYKTYKKKNAWKIFDAFFEKYVSDILKPIRLRPLFASYH